MTIFCEFSWLDSILYVYPILSYDMVFYYWTMYGPVAYVCPRPAPASASAPGSPPDIFLFCVKQTSVCFLIFNKFHV